MCSLKFEVSPVDRVGLNWAASKSKTNSWHKVAQNAYTIKLNDDQMAKESKENTYRPKKCIL